MHWHNRLDYHMLAVSILTAYLVVITMVGTGQRRGVGLRLHCRDLPENFLSSANITTCENCRVARNPDATVNACCRRTKIKVKVSLKDDDPTPTSSRRRSSRTSKQTVTPSPPISNGTKGQLKRYRQAAAEKAALKAENKKLKSDMKDEAKRKKESEKEIEELKKELRANEVYKIMMLDYLEKRNNEVTAKKSKETLATALKRLLIEKLPHVRNDKKALALIQGIKDGKLLGAAGTAALDKYCDDYVREKFKAWEMARSHDLSPVACSLTAHNSVRSAEAGLEKGKQGIIPERTTLQRIFREVEDLAQKYVKRTTRERSDGSEITTFDWEALIRLLFREYGIDDGGEGHEIAVSMDGAEIADGVNEVTIGFKWVDPKGKDPTNGEPLFQQDDDGNWCGIQSRSFCFPVIVFTARETEELYNEKEVNEFFDFCDLLNTKGLDAKDEWPALPQIKIVFCCDQSSTWKIAGSGGGCGSTKKFCPVCSCLNSERAWRCEDKCSLFGCNDEDDDHVCAHWPVESEAYVEQCRADLKAIMKKELGFPDDKDLPSINRWHHTEEDNTIRSKSKIFFGDNAAAKEAKITHIDYKPTNQDTRRSFGSLLDKELNARGLTIPRSAGLLEERRAKLRAHLEVGHN